MSHERKQNRGLAAMYQMNDQEAAMSNYPYGELRNCDESRGDGEVKLACGCMLPVVAGALSPDGQLKLKTWQTQMVPRSRRVNGTRTMVMRDTGSTTCVVKKSLVKPEQMTGSYELCMLIDGIVKRYPTAIRYDTRCYFNVRSKADISQLNLPHGNRQLRKCINRKTKK